MSEKMDDFSRLYKVALKSKAINLTHGNPAFEGPDFVKKLPDNFWQMASRYTTSHGETEFLKPVFEWFKNDLRVSTKGTGLSNVVFGNGVTHLWSCFLNYIVKHNKSFMAKTPVVLTSEMTYGLHARQVEDMGLQLAGVPLRKEKGFKLSADDLLDSIRAIEKDNTRKVVCLKIDNPHNPTGAVLGQAEVQKIAEVCMRNKMLIFEDLVYHGLEYGDSIYSFSNFGRIRQSVVSAYSLSKSAGMPGLRAGVCFSANEHIANYLSGTIKKECCSVSLTAQSALAEFVRQENAEDRKKYLASIRSKYNFRRKIFEAAFKGNISILGKNNANQILSTINEDIRGECNDILHTGIRGLKIANQSPESGFFHLLEITDPAYGSKDNEAVAETITKNGVFLLPQSSFVVPSAIDSAGANYLRGTFSFVKPEIVLLAAAYIKRGVDFVLR